MAHMGLNTLTSRIPKCSTIYLPEARELAHCLYESLSSTSMLGTYLSSDELCTPLRGENLLHFDWSSVTWATQG